MSDRPDKGHFFLERSSADEETDFEVAMRQRDSYLASWRRLDETHRATLVEVERLKDELRCLRESDTHEWAHSMILENERLRTLLMEHLRDSGDENESGGSR